MLLGRSRVPGKDAKKSSSMCACTHTRTIANLASGVSLAAVCLIGGMRCVQHRTLGAHHLTCDSNAPSSATFPFTSPTFIVGHAQQNSSIFAMTLHRVLRGHWRSHQPRARACGQRRARARRVATGARGVLVCIMRRLGQYTLKKAHLVPKPVAVKGRAEVGSCWGRRLTA
jgi:hypothetical protein